MADSVVMQRRFNTVADVMGNPILTEKKYTVYDFYFLSASLGLCKQYSR